MNASRNFTNCQQPQYSYKVVDVASQPDGHYYKALLASYTKIWPGSKVDYVDQLLLRTPFPHSIVLMAGNPLNHEFESQLERVLAAIYTYTVQPI